MDGTNISASRQIEGLSSITLNHNNILYEGIDSQISYNDFQSKNNYSENSRIWNAIKYETCAFDFVPIVSQEYLIIDKESHQICGTYTARPFKENLKTERTITSILFADQWDIRKMMPIIQEKKWNYIYFVMNKAVPKFASFFKVKDFLATLPSNVKFFVDTDEMRQFFEENHDAYLPKKIIAPETEKYEAILCSIHSDRIHSGAPSKNVFLSICIPTYNRGELAKRDVQVALASNLDAEIEVLVCDNGSTIEAEAYDEIEVMRDSRLRYGRSEKNQGYMNNIIKCVEQSSGHFAVLFSDEDLIIPENIVIALDWLLNNETIGACVFSGSGHSDFVSKVYDSGIDAYIRACNMNYITGTCLNLKYVQELLALERIRSYRGNRFVEVYTHCAIAAELSFNFDIGDSSVKLWQLGNQISKELDLITGKFRSFCLPEDRFRQELGVMEIASKHFSEDDLGILLVSRVNATFYMISCAYKSYGMDYAEEYPWATVWKEHYKSCLGVMRMLGGKLKKPEHLFAEIDKTFFYWIICKREQRLRKPEENLLPSLQSQVAKYYYDKGTPIENIDFDRIKKDLTPWVEQFLEERS